MTTGGDPEGRLDRVLGLFLRLAWSTQETNVYKQKAAEMWLRLKSGPNLFSAFLWFVLLWLRKLERARSKCPRHQDCFAPTLSAVWTQRIRKEQNCDEITPEALALGLVTEDVRVDLKVPLSNLYKTTEQHVGKRCCERNSATAKVLRSPSVA